MSQNNQRPNLEAPPPMPHWVKVLLILFIALLLLVVIAHLMGFRFGSHGVGSADLLALSGIHHFGSLAGIPLPHIQL